MTVNLLPKIGCIAVTYTTAGMEALVLLGLAGALLLARRARRQSTAGSGNSPGALIRMDMNSTVGVLLDEFPRGEQRELQSYF